MKIQHFSAVSTLLEKGAWLVGNAGIWWGFGENLMKLCWGTALFLFITTNLLKKSFQCISGI